MGSTFLSLHCHIVFSTKERAPSSNPHGVRISTNTLAERLADWAAFLKLSAALKIMFTFSLDYARRIVWRISCRKKRLPCGLRRSSWQEGYAALTVSWTHIEPVRRYIATQEEHHRHTDYVAELKQLLEKNGVKYEEKYLL